MSTHDSDYQEGDDDIAPTDSSSGGSRAFATVGVAGTLLTISFVRAIIRTTAPHVSTKDLILDIAWSVVFGIGLVLTYLAWKVGGFKNLKNARLRTLSESLYDRFALGAYRLGQLALGLGMMAGALVVVSAVTNEPVPGEKGIAQFVIGAIIGGVALSGFTRRRDVTVGARINRMKVTMKELGREIDSSSKKLAAADQTLHEIDRDLSAKFRALANRRTVNDELSKILSANPEVVKAIRGAQAGEQRRITWFQILSIAASFVLGYVVNLTSSSAGELLQRVFG